MQKARNVRDEKSAGPKGSVPCAQVSGISVRRAGEGKIGGNAFANSSGIEGLQGAGAAF